MNHVAQLVTWEIRGVLLALFALLVMKIVTGQINTSFLLMKKEGDGSFSPERVQLLLATFAGASQYLSHVFKDPSHLPEVTQNWLLLIGGSHAIYLGRRVFLSFFNKQQ